MRRFLVVTILWLATTTGSSAQIPGLSRIRVPRLGQIRELVRPTAPQSTVSPNFRPADYDRIAVLVIDNSGRPHDGHQRQVEDAFMSAILAKGYTLAARSDVQRVLSEMKFESDGYTAEDVSRIGHMLNVRALLIASIDKDETNTERDGNRISYYTSAAISARLVSVLQAEVLWVATHSGRTYGEQTRNADSNIVPTVATAVANALPSRIMTTANASSASSPSHP
jgi:hypothetical protein